MADSTMSKMQKGKRPSEMSEARFKEKTLKPKVRPGDTGRYKAPKVKPKTKTLPGPLTEKEMNLKRSDNLTKSQKTLPEFLKKKIIESKKSGAGYSGD